MHLVEGGIVDHLVKKRLSEVSNNKLPHGLLQSNLTTNGMEQISLSHMQGSFIVLIFGYILSSLVLIMEIYTGRN